MNKDDTGEWEKRFGELVEGLREFDDGWYATELKDFVRTTIKSSNRALIESLVKKIAAVLTAIVIVAIIGVILAPVIGLWREETMVVCPVKVNEKTTVLEFPTKEGDCGTAIKMKLRFLRI